MDEGTDARDILENKVFPLRRGQCVYVGRGGGWEILRVYQELIGFESSFCLNLPLLFPHFSSSPFFPSSLLPFFPSFRSHWPFLPLLLTLIQPPPPSPLLFS